jgi:hypothetical protein
LRAALLRQDPKVSPSSPLAFSEVLRLTLRTPNRAATSRQSLPIAHRTRLPKRPLPPRPVVRRDVLSVLRTPPPHVLANARATPPVQAAQRLQVRPKLRNRQVLPTPRTPPQLGRMLAGRVDAFLRGRRIIPANLFLTGRLWDVRDPTGHINGPPSNPGLSSARRT